MFRALDDLSVLIVEDNAFMRKLMRSMLRQIPVGEICEFENGREALKLLNNKHFDVVLLDWVMPAFSGNQFLESLNRRRQKSKTPVPPVLIVTANASRQVVLEAAQRGADGVIAKPFSVAVLRDRIFAVINREALTATRQTDATDQPQKQVEQARPISGPASDLIPESMEDDSFFI